MKKISVSLAAITLLLFGNLYVSAQEQAIKPAFKEGDTLDCAPLTGEKS